jgi:hypothetical protein
LNSGVEVTIKGSVNQLPELISELDKYWEEGTPILEDLIGKYQDFEPVKVL